MSTRYITVIIAERGDRGKVSIRSKYLHDKVKAVGDALNNGVPCANMENVIVWFAAHIKQFLSYKFFGPFMYPTSTIPSDRELQAFAERMVADALRNGNVDKN